MSVIIPVYNEEQTIHEVLERVAAVDLGGIELEVGILDEQDVSSREGQPHPDRGALSHVDRAVVDMHGQVRRQPTLVDGAARPVGRSVVRDDDLHRDATEVHSGDSFEDLLDGLLFVVDRNDDG